MSKYNGFSISDEEIENFKRTHQDGIRLHLMPEQEKIPLERNRWRAIGVSDRETMINFGDGQFQPANYSELGNVIEHLTPLVPETDRDYNDCDEFLLDQ